MDRIRSILNGLYNSALEERRDCWEKEGEVVTLYDQMRGLTQNRRNDPDGIGAIAVKAERGMLVRLERAFQAFFRRCKAPDNPGYPRFRPIGRMETIDLLDPEATMVKKRPRGYVIRPKGFGTLRLFPSRPLPEGELKALRIVRKPNRVYVDLTYEVKKEPLPRCDSAVGIDLGVRKRAVLSTGGGSTATVGTGQRSGGNREGLHGASGGRREGGRGSASWRGCVTGRV